MTIFSLHSIDCWWENIEKLKDERKITCLRFVKVTHSNWFSDFLSPWNESSILVVSSSPSQVFPSIKKCFHHKFIVTMQSTMVVDIRWSFVCFIQSFALSTTKWEGRMGKTSETEQIVELRGGSSWFASPSLFLMIFRRLVKIVDKSLKKNELGLQSTCFALISTRFFFEDNLSPSLKIFSLYVSRQNHSLRPIKLVLKQLKMMLKFLENHGRFKSLIIVDFFWKEIPSIILILQDGDWIQIDIFTYSINNEIDKKKCYKRWE